MERKGEKKKKEKKVKKSQTESNSVKVQPNSKVVNIKFFEVCQKTDFYKIHSNLKDGIQIP
jgi:hypothetical protein